MYFNIVSVMKIFNGRICRTREGVIVLDDDGLVVCKCDDGTMLSISLDIIMWEADILQHGNEDNIYLISTKAMPTVGTSLSSFTSEVQPLEVYFVKTLYELEEEKNEKQLHTYGLILP